jgi:hypothetical protein
MTCCKHGRVLKRTQDCARNSGKESDLLEDVNIDGETLLKLTSNK